MQNDQKSASTHDALIAFSEKPLQEIDALENHLRAGRGDHDAFVGLRHACERLRHVNRVLLAVRRSLGGAVGETNSDDLIRNVCRSLVTSGGYAKAWIMLFGPDGKHHTWAHAGLGAPAVTFGRKLKAGWLPRCGREVVISETGRFLSDAGAACGDCFLGEECWRHGSLVFRLVWGERTLGVMTVAMPQGLSAGEDEGLLVQEVASEVAHALHVENLKWSNDRYRTLVEDMPAMVCRFFPDGCLTDVNESYCRMFGRARDELMGHNFFTFLPEDARETVRRHFLSLTPGNPMVTYEHEVITPDGSKCWQEWTDRAIFSDRSELQEFQSIGRDITERRSAVEALRASEKRYRAYIDNAPVGIFIFDEEGCYVYANGAACRMVGYTREELLALSVMDLVVPEDAEKGAALFGELKSTGHIRLERPPLRQKNGEFIYGIIEAVVLGEGLYMAYVVDQTEQRKLQTQLQQVQKIESVGRLAAGVAHDFNNMLSPILGYAELLLDDLPTGTECYDFSLEIKNAAERSRNMIRQLLAFSRKQVLSLDFLDLRDIVSGVQALLKRTLREDIELAIHLEATPCPVRADVGQVEQILMNLAVNAQDAMPGAGSLTIAVRMAVLEPAERPPELSLGHYVLLEVADTGHGMDATTAEHAFEPFFSIKGKGGAGLGLSTVHGIVKQHGGCVVVETEEGKGTAFSLYFPCEMEAQGVAVVAQKEEARATSGDETVLVAEDNEAVRNMAVSVLERQGYRVYNAASGEAALAVLEEQGGKVDLLLTDVIMPGMNGRELYIRVSERFSGVRVLYMSGYSDDVIAHHGVLEEGIHFIQKPFTVEGLIRKVGAVLDVRYGAWK